MSFRSTLFWAIVATVVAMAAIERGARAVATAGADRLEARLEGRLDDAVADLESLLREAVGGSGDPAALRSEREPGAVYTPVPGGAGLVGPLPEVDRGPAWAARTVRLRDGAIVSVAVPLAWWERYARDAGRLEALAVPLLLAVAFAVASGLAHRLTGPLRDLTVATERLADESFAGTVPIPAGDDELARLARSFDRARDAVRSRIDRERTFTRFVSHELRTPLSALKLQVERASLPGVDPADVTPRLERSVRRLEQVLTALLHLARAHERDDAAHGRAPLREVIADVAEAARDGGGAVLAVSDATPPGAQVRDARLLRQALANLIDNAVRHGSTRAALRAWTDGASLEIRVVDDGPGVDAAVLPHLAEPFRRGDTSAEGLGLGLTLVAAIAERLDGELVLRNRDAGFEAALRIPRLVSFVPDVASESESPPGHE